MDPIISFILDGVLPSEAKEAEKIRRISAQFQFSKDKRLYRLLFRGPYLLCLRPGVVEGLLTKLHEGICDSHMGGRSLAHRVKTQGFWWPNMQSVATKIKSTSMLKNAIGIKSTLQISTSWEET